MLFIDNLRSAYGRIDVLHGISLDAKEAEIVALLGANGAGKTDAAEGHFRGAAHLGRQHSI
jgi:ABC-type branched-subunit amino acid transport system ATPase component